MTEQPSEAATEPSVPRVERSEDGHPVFVHICAEGRERRTTLPQSHERGWWWSDEEQNTLMPSIHCGSCNTHGWWQEGKWESV